MSAKSVSTAISDLVLAGCSFYAALNVFSISAYASSGFVSIALAACFGVLKFGVVLPSIQQKVIRMHALLTWIASVVGETLQSHTKSLRQFRLRKRRREKDG